MSDQIEELLIGYSLNQLSPEETLAAEQLLDRQPDTANQRQAIEALLGLLAAVAPAVEAPTHLRQQILAAAQPMVQQPSAAQHEDHHRPVWDQFQWQWRDGIIAALALLTLGLGWTIGQLRQQIATQGTVIMALQRPQTDIFTMKATPKAVGSSGRVLLNVQSGYAVVLVQHLPLVSKGEAYHLWAFTPHSKVLCGRFVPNQTDAQVNIPLSQVHLNGDVRFMRISREAITPTSPPKKVLVMTSES